ncbi:MAG: hypothetical protein LBM70_02800 [Victivallales bacterium]|jgi:predicted NBD/HSP70 family sugar kinase|nr:hypothetical protein [Victivallales bacterium]
MEIKVNMKCPPELDLEFVPAALWNKEYAKLVEADPKSRKIALCVERANGCVSRFETAILSDSEANRPLTLRYVERIVKFLLWARGGWKLTVAGAEELVLPLAKIYSSTGERKFDYAVIGKKIYDHDFTVVGCDYADAPESKEISLALGGHFDGCRIGFDLGGSDRKCAAVIDGKTVHSEEVVWDPYFQNDINYHIDGIVDSLKRAAATLPRIDAIGGSAAGVYVDNQPRIASLFRGIPEEQFATHVRPIFLEIAKQFPGIPFVVLNDGEVTALAGAVSLGKNALLGLAMGTSEAVGFVTPAGTLTDHLNELAFAPVDYRESDAPTDEWSGDAGVGALYLSQQAVARLSVKAGFDFPDKTPFAEQLKLVQKAMERNDERAEKIYRTIGAYLGYAIGHYAMFYPVENLLLLGRVSSGNGGSIIIEVAKAVLAQEFPELNIGFHIPDEAFKRHGQAVIAATLPELG